MAKQVRAVIDASVVPLAEKILAETGIKTHSQLVTVLIKNYGQHFVDALRTQQ
jgi:hypothetical protein